MDNFERGIGMVEIKNLTRFYGNIPAVKNLSFTVEDGEILGFLGPNGAVRNHDMQIMVKAFELAGYDEETLKSKFGALYQAFQFGAPPHAGMAPGVDRMIMLLRQEENIREVIAFPMSGFARL